MKKLILPLLILGFVFTSCEKEDMNSASELQGIDGKAKKAKSNESSLNWNMNDCSGNTRDLIAGQNSVV